MWIMIVMSSFVMIGNSQTNAMTSLNMVAVEMNTRESCIAAAEFSKKQPKVYNAFCVKK